MKKLIYITTGIVMGVLIGFIGFTIYYQPLLEYKRNEFNSASQSVNSLLISDVISSHALNTTRFAFQELEYEQAITIIGNEMALPLEAMKLGARNNVMNLAVSMLGACLAKANNDLKNVDIYERSAIAICKSVSAMEECEKDKLYEFIRKYADTNQC
jgi:hypothetical protein